MTRLTFVMIGLNGMLSARPDGFGSGLIVTNF